MIGIAVFAAASITSAPLGSDAPLAPVIVKESIQEWRKRFCVDSQGYNVVHVDCPFSATMKVRADGPYVVKKLPPGISKLLQTQLSAAMLTCDDPINVFYGSISRYHGAAWYGTRKGILVFMKIMNPNKLADYMNPSVEWPDWPPDVDTCELQKKRSADTPPQPDHAPDDVEPAR